MTNAAIQPARVKVAQAIAQLDSVFVSRTEAIRCVWLALLTGQNFILVGDPGTAKTALVKACFAHIDGARVFSTLCGSFATEDKIFGPTNIKAFQEGRWGRVTTGRLADCDLAFLDEMLKANDGTLNGMLTALNEREYEGEKIALRTCGAATNWPEVMSRSDNVAALWDRILLRARVEEIVEEDKRLALLAAVDVVAHYVPKVRLTLADLDQVRKEVEAVQITDAVRRSMLATQKRLEGQKIKNSSRRYGALQKALRASAWLDGRTEVLLDDFDALKFGLWTNRDQIDAVEKVIEAVDHDLVTKCQTVLKDVTKQCRANTSAAAAAGLIKLAAKTATDVNDMLKQYGARTKSRALIKEDITKLKEVYLQLKDKVEPHLAGKDQADATV